MRIIDKILYVFFSNRKMDYKNPYSTWNKVKTYFKRPVWNFYFCRKDGYNYHFDDNSKNKWFQLYSKDVQCKDKTIHADDIYCPFETAPQFELLIFGRWIFGGLLIPIKQNGEFEWKYEDILWETQEYMVSYGMNILEAIDNCTYIEFKTKKRHNSYTENQLTSKGINEFQNLQNNTLKC